MDQGLYLIPLWVTFFPMVMTLIIYFVEQKSEKMRNALSVGTAVATFMTLLALYPLIVQEGVIIQYTLFDIIENLGISFRVDIVSYSLALLAAFVWMLVTVYSIDYMDHEHAGNRYYPILTFTLGSCLGIFMAGDMFTLFIFFELMSLISYVLVVHEETEEALKAGYKYLIMTIIGGLALFFGIIATFELAGTVTFSRMGLIEVESALAMFCFISYMIGFGMKAGMFPLHVWLPDAHPVAPSPASALLSGIMLKTGAYGLIRVVFHVFTPELMIETRSNIILAIAGIITILLGSAVAITQDDLKRRLAYSSVGQMGYIILGLSILNTQAMIGDMFHIFSHALMKSTLFLAAGAIILKTGKRSIKELKGIGREMPYTMICFTLAALAMIGIPPLNGFLSKWTLSLGALEGGSPTYVVVLLISSLLNGLYYLPVIIAAFFGDEEENHAYVKNEASYKMLIPIAILAVTTIIFGLFPGNVPFDLSRMAAEFLMSSGL